MNELNNRHRLLSLPKAARALNISRNTLASRVSDGLINAIQSQDGKLSVEPEELVRYCREYLKDEAAAQNLIAHLNANTEKPIQVMESEKAEKLGRNVIEYLLAVGKLDLENSFDENKVFAELVKAVNNAETAVRILEKAEKESERLIDANKKLQTNYDSMHNDYIAASKKIRELRSKESWLSKLIPSLNSRNADAENKARVN